MLRQKAFLALSVALIVVACARTEPQREADRDAPPPAPKVADAPPATQAAEDKKDLGRNDYAVYADEVRAKAESERQVSADAAAAGSMSYEMREVGPGFAPSAVAPAEAPAYLPAPSPAMALKPGDVLGAARYAPMVQDTEKYQHLDESAVLRVAEHPVSTFSIDVDTGSYSNLRRFLRDGSLPRADAVRVEEMINYFDYAYAPPKDRSTPFAVHTEIAPTPWNAKTQLLRIGLQGWKAEGALPPSNLVFLVDVSGSMDEPDKLPLVKQGLELLVKELGKRDRISLVVYAGAAGVVLEPTPGDRKDWILNAIDNLQAGGSTNGAQGIEAAYALAQKAYIKGGINRVLLATDGDFNVGTVDFEQLKSLVAEKRKSGVALSTLGFGTGNYNDQLMEQLADAGNGNYTYVDGIEEARRALVQMRAATLQTIAKDVKIQVEFNPAAVAEYRLIGYENRALKREDFNNDQVDAGEIGAGHSVTALYEIALRGSGGEKVDALRYQVGEGKVDGSGEIAFLRLRYKAPDGDTSKLIEQPITRAAMDKDFASASASLRFAAAVSAFGQVLRGGRYTGQYGYDDVLKLARSASGDDAQGWKKEFAQLVAQAQGLSTHAATKSTTEVSD